MLATSHAHHQARGPEGRQGHGLYVGHKWELGRESTNCLTGLGWLSWESGRQGTP